MCSCCWRRSVTWTCVTRSMATLPSCWPPASTRWIAAYSSRLSMIKSFMNVAARDCEEVDQGGGWHWAGKYDMNFWDIPLTASNNTQIRIIACVRGHSQMTSQHWTTNGNLKSWRKLTRRTKGHQKRWWMMKNPMIQENPSKSGLRRSHQAQLDPFCNTDSVNSDGNKLDSKNNSFWFWAVHKWRHQF